MPLGQLHLSRSNLPADYQYWNCCKATGICRACHGPEIVRIHRIRSYTNPDNNCGGAREERLGRISGGSYGEAHSRKRKLSDSASDTKLTSSYQRRNIPIFSQSLDHSLPPSSWPHQPVACSPLRSFSNSSQYPHYRNHFQSHRSLIYHKSFPSLPSSYRPPLPIPLSSTTASSSQNLAGPTSLPTSPRSESLEAC